MPRVTRGFDSIYGYPYTEKWAKSMCESSIWNQLSTTFPIVDYGIVETMYDIKNTNGATIYKV